MDQAPATDPGQETLPLSASVQVLTLPEGIYAFTVRSGGAVRREPGRLTVPAVQVGLAPVQPDGAVEFIMAPSTLDRCLACSTDVVMVRIAGGDASLLLTSLRPPSGGPVLAIDVKRLDAPEAAAETEPEIEPGPAAAGPQRGPGARLLVHVQNVGDLEFDEGWAGAGGQKLWIEAFAVAPLEPLGIEQIEYRGIIGDGFETPWLSNGARCGSRGRRTPLMAFAIRLKPGAADQYLCEYSGSFRSGATVGPCRDGDLCRSDEANDPLEAMELRIIERRTVGAAGSRRALSMRRI